MCEKSVLELYVKRTKRLEAQGTVLLSFNCPFVACSKEIKTERVEPGEIYTPLSTCPHCGQFFWKIIQHTRACGLVAFRCASPDTPAFTAAAPLSIQIPANSSSLYAAGWAYADRYTRIGGDLAAENTRDWTEEKANGFWDRLAAERSAQSKKLGCTN